MQTHDGDSHDQGDYLVLLDDQVVECVSIADAIAVRNADDFLSDRRPADFLAADLDGIASVLTRYGRDFAAQMIEDGANRSRAAESSPKGV